MKIDLFVYKLLSVTCVVLLVKVNQKIVGSSEVWSPLNDIRLNWVDSDLSFM